MGCRKVRYPSKAEAKRIRRVVGDRGLHPYRCLTCLGKPWHLGHMPPGIRRGDTSRGELYGDGQ